MTLAPAPTRHDRCWNITDVRDCGEIQALAVGGAVIYITLVGPCLFRFED